MARARPENQAADRMAVLADPMRRAIFEILAEGPSSACDAIMSMAASASATVVATTTPLPAASPSAFTTIGAPRART